MAINGVMVSTQERCYDMYTGRDTCVHKKKVPESRFFPYFLYSKKMKYFIVFIM